MCVPSAQAGQTRDYKNALVLFPQESMTAPMPRAIYFAIQSEFDKAPTLNVSLFAENLDLYLFPGPADKQAINEFLGKKYANTKIDLIIPVAPPSLDFALSLRNSHFPGIPIVYCAEVAHGNKRLEHRSDVTGTAVTLDFAGTIELARTLRPGMKQVAVVAGTGATDQYLLSVFHEVFKEYAGKLDLIDLTGRHLDDLLEQVSRLPESTCIVFLFMRRDGSGRLLPSWAVQKQVSQAANAPLFSLFDTVLSYGCVGGRMSQLEEVARKTGEIALRVLSGESAAAIEPVVVGHNPAMFNWRQLKRWGIDESALPPGSIVRFKEFSLWDEYRRWIIGTFAFVCLLMLLIVLLANNVIRRRKVEISLVISEENLRRAQKVGAIGSLTVDIHKRMVSWSAGANEIFGLAPESELTYDAFIQIVHPDDRERVAARWGVAMKGEPYDLEYRVLVDGKEKWIRAVIRFEFDQRGRPFTANGIVQDITANKQAEEQTSMLRQELAHVTRVSTVGGLAQGLSHEINQPLMAIQANAEAAQSLLECEQPDLAEARAAMGDIVFDIKRAQKVIQRIRNLVRNVQVEFTHVDLNRLVMDTIEVVQANAAAQGVAIRVDLSPHLPAVKGDAVQIQQVVLNLIVNGIEAASGIEEGERSVTVTTAALGDGSVNFFVSDTGPGIDPQAVKKIFTPFFTTKPQGLGLGLSISRTIAEAHGGTLGAAVNLDKGTTFCFQIPPAQNGTRRTRSKD